MGVGKTNGITTGVVRMLLQIVGESAINSSTLIAIGYFNENGVKNVAMIDDCSDGSCSNSTWKRSHLLPFFLFSFL